MKCDLCHVVNGLVKELGFVQVEEDEFVGCGIIDIGIVVILFVFVLVFVPFAFLVYICVCGCIIM